MFSFLTSGKDDMILSIMDCILTPIRIQESKINAAPWESGFGSRSGSEKMVLEIDTEPDRPEPDRHPENADKIVRIHNTGTLLTIAITDCLGAAT